MRMSILSAYYYISASYLEEYLPCIPQLKLTDAKTYYGKIKRKGNDFISISLSRWNLDCGPIRWWDEKDIDKIIDTICHEFAHMLFWEHGEEHTEVTENFKIIVKSKLKIREFENQLKMAI